jgi:hypothetical protein
VHTFAIYRNCQLPEKNVQQFGGLLVAAADICNAQIEDVASY